MNRLFAALLAICAWSVSPLNFGFSADSVPNVIVFLADDLGYGDLGCYGNTIIQSPNLDTFAEQGVKLTQCYAACAVCSPSRSAILTGRTPYRNGVFTWIPEGREIHLRVSETTIPKLLQAKGFSTAHFGKWHLNSYFNSPKQPQPNDHGYDWWLATQNNAAPSHEHPSNFVKNGKPIGLVPDDYSAPFIAKEAIAWLKEQRKSSQPFFMTVWSHEPHYPIKSAPEFKAKYSQLQDSVQIEHHANVTQLDHAFGLLMKSLDEQKLTDNTLVIFTSDNGPEGDGVKSPGRGSTGGLRGRKRSVYEGGIRVPGLVRWPGKIAGKTTSTVPVIGSDIFATVAAVTGTETPKDRVIDGGDMRPAWTNQPVTRAQPLYWRCDIAPEPLNIAMRIGDWKILADEKMTIFELYNVEKDPSETQELHEQEPAKYAEMKAELIKLNTEIEAEGPDWWKDYAKNAKKKGKAKE